MLCLSLVLQMADLSCCLNKIGSSAGQEGGFGVCQRHELLRLLWVYMYGFSWGSAALLALLQGCAKPC